MADRKDLPDDLAKLRDSYVELFGSLPALPAARFELSGEVQVRHHIATRLMDEEQRRLRAARLERNERTIRAARANDVRQSLDRRLGGLENLAYRFRAHAAGVRW